MPASSPTIGVVLIVTLVQLANVIGAHNMSCLVMRPGYGLVSEECPSHAVGCRIRAKKDHIEWYELSRLYDRNQLVCVYPEEYGSLTGCMRKPSGSVRCWCGGRENCNDPETSRDLFEAFAGGDTQAVAKIGEWLVSDKDESSWKRFTTTQTPELTTTRRKTVKTTKPPRTTATTPRTTTTTTTTTTTPTTSKKRIGMHKKPTQVVNVVDIREKATFNENDISELGDSFEETRKKLEKEMREEDERLRQMLADEEDEQIEEIDDNDITAEDQREMERERYRMERRRAEETRLDEDVILKRIEEDEMHRRAEQIDRPDIFSNDDFGNSARFSTPACLVLAILGFLVI